MIYLHKKNAHPNSSLLNDKNNLKTQTFFITLIFELFLNVKVVNEVNLYKLEYSDIRFVPQNSPDRIIYMTLMTGDNFRKRDLKMRKFTILIHNITWQFSAAKNLKRTKTVMYNAARYIENLIIKSSIDKLYKCLCQHVSNDI